MSRLRLKVNDDNVFSSFLNGMSYMPSCGVRRPSVCPSVCPAVNIGANRFFSQANGWIATKLAHDGSRLLCMKDVKQFKVNGHVI